MKDSQPIRYRVQNTGYQDAPGTHWVLQQHKKAPGSNEDCITWNKEKYTGNQQWREGNQDSKQQFVQNEEINIQPGQNEETKTQKNEERLRNLRERFQHLNHRGARKRRGRATNWKLTWKNNEEELPQSVKGNKTSRKSRKLRESQRSWIQGGTHQGTS